MDLNSTVSSNKTTEDDTKIQVVTPLLILILLIGFVSQILNAGVFLIVIKMRTIRRNPYHFLVMMLSLSDFLIGLSNVCIGPGIIFPSLYKSRILVVSQFFLLTNGLYLSLLQICLISLQRFLVICKEKWNTIIFCNRRKYVVCIASWIAVVATNMSFVSPPEREFRFSDDRFVSYVYGGFHNAFTFYNRFLTSSLLLSTIIFYLITLRFVIKNVNKVQPLPENSRCTQDSKMQVEAISNTDNRKTPSSPTMTSSKTTQVTHHSQFVRTRRKMKETLFLVGLLILFLLVLSGPLLIAILMDNSSQFLRLSYCICTINSLVNPFIYLWKLVNVRNHIKSALTCSF